MTWRAWAFVVKWCRDRTSCSRVEKNASAAALSKHEPTLPIDCDTPSFRHSCGETPCSVGRSAIGVKITVNGGGSTAHRRGHLDRIAGQVGVGVIRGRMASSRRECRSSTEAKYRLPSSVGISVMSRHHLTFGAAAVNSRCSKSGDFGLTGPGGSIHGAGWACGPSPVGASSPQRCSHAPLHRLRSAWIGGEP